jgi:hypothetical protein
MKLTKSTKNIARSAIESYHTKDDTTQKLLLQKWKLHHENQEQGYTKEGLIALKLAVRILCKQT